MGLQHRSLRSQADSIHALPSSDDRIRNVPISDALRADGQVLRRTASLYSHVCIRSSFRGSVELDVTLDAAYAVSDEDMWGHMLV